MNEGLLLAYSLEQSSFVFVASQQTGRGLVDLKKGALFPTFKIQDCYCIRDIKYVGKHACMYHNITDGSLNPTDELKQSESLNTDSKTAVQ